MDRERIERLLSEAKARVGRLTEIGHGVRHHELLTILLAEAVLELDQARPARP